MGETLDEVRDRLNHDRDLRRASEELQRFQEAKEADAAEYKEVQRRRETMHKEFLLQWKIDACKRAGTVREFERREATRQEKVEKRQEAQTRKFRETQFVETMRATNNMKPGQTQTMVLDQAGEGKMESTMLPPDNSNLATDEAEQFQKSYEQHERQRRHA